MTPMYLEDKNRFVVAEADSGRYLARAKEAFAFWKKDALPMLVPDYNRVEFVRDAD
jgi:hypothetical protein